jgi:hypothetical protein
MPEYNFQLRGWHAIVAVAALLAFWGIQAYLRVTAVDDAMRDAVRAELLKEYSGQGPKDVARLVAEARAGSPVEPVPPLIQRDVEFNSIAARGKIGGSVTFVRADLVVDGGPPPDGRPVRYFRVQRRFMGEGWMVIGESDSYTYLMQLVP